MAPADADLKLRIQNIQKALKKAEDNNNTKDIESLLHLLGRAIAEREDEASLEEAIKLHTRELRYALERGNIFTCFTYERLGSCSYELGRYGQALQHYEEGLRSAEAADSELEQMKALFNTHRSLLKLDRPAEALARLRQALDLRPRVNPRKEAGKEDWDAGKSDTSEQNVSKKEHELAEISGKVLLGLFVQAVDSNETQEEGRYKEFLELVLSQKGEGSSGLLAEMNRDAAAALAEAAGRREAGADRETELLARAAMHFEKAGLQLEGRDPQRAGAYYELACAAHTRVFAFGEAVRLARKVEESFRSASRNEQQSARILAARAETAKQRWEQGCEAYLRADGPRMRPLVVSLERVQRLLPDLLGAGENEAGAFRARLERRAGGLMEPPELREGAEERAAALRCAAAALEFRAAADGEAEHLAALAGRVEAYAAASGFEAARAYGLAARAVACSRAKTLPDGLEESAEGPRCWQVRALLDAEEALALSDRLALGDDRLEADALAAYLAAREDPDCEQALIEDDASCGHREVPDARARLEAAEGRLRAREEEIRKMEEADGARAARQKRERWHGRERGTDGDSERIFGPKISTGLDEEEGPEIDLEAGERKRQRTRAEEQLFANEGDEVESTEVLGSVHVGREAARQGRHARASDEFQQAAEKHLAAGRFLAAGVAFTSAGLSALRNARGKQAGGGGYKDLFQRGEESLARVQGPAPAVERAQLALARETCEILVYRRAARAGREELEKARPALGRVPPRLEQVLKTLPASAASAAAARLRIDLRLAFAEATLLASQRGTVGVFRKSFQELSQGLLNEASGALSLAAEAAEAAGYEAGRQRSAYLRARTLVTVNQYRPAREALDALLANGGGGKLTDKERRRAERLRAACERLRGVPRGTPAEEFQAFFARARILAGPDIRDDMAACEALASALSAVRRAPGCVPPLDELQARALQLRLRMGIARQYLASGEPAFVRGGRHILRSLQKLSDEAVHVSGAGDGLFASLYTALARLTALEARVLLADSGDAEDALPPEVWAQEKIPAALQGILEQIGKVASGEEGPKGGPCPAYRGPVSRLFRLVEAGRRARWLQQVGCERAGDEAGARRARRAAREAAVLEEDAESSDSEEEVVEDDVPILDEFGGAPAAPQRPHAAPPAARRQAAAARGRDSPEPAPARRPPKRPAPAAAAGPSGADRHHMCPVCKRRNFSPIFWGCCGSVICLACNRLTHRQCPVCKKDGRNKKRLNDLEEELQRLYPEEVKARTDDYNANDINVVRAVPKAGTAPPRPRPPQPTGTGPECPNCGTPGLRELTSSSARHPGRKFYGCSGPSCVGADGRPSFVGWTGEPLQPRRAGAGAGPATKAA